MPDWRAAASMSGRVGRVASSCLISVVDDHDFEDALAASIADAVTGRAALAAIEPQAGGLLFADTVGSELLRVRGFAPSRNAYKCVEPVAGSRPRIATGR